MTGLVTLRGQPPTTIPHQLLFRALLHVSGAAGAAWMLPGRACSSWALSLAVLLRAAPTHGLQELGGRSVCWGRVVGVAQVAAGR
jgi:hypothetical protein